MKKLIFLFLLIPSLCFGGVVLENVSCGESVPVGKAKGIMFMGDSITRGYGGTYTNPNGTWDDISGYRKYLQEKLGIWSFRVVGDNYENDISINMLPYHQPRNFAFNNETAEEVTARALAEPIQHETWFPYSDKKNTIIICLGTNNLQMGEDPETEIAAMSAISDYIDEVHFYDSTINIFVCLIPPTSLVFFNEWIESYNNRLQIMVDEKGKGKDNLFTVDLYNALKDCWDAPSNQCNSDSAHPNNTGYEIIADELYEKMSEERLR
jgi:lysophospholipase L1-like esterase